MRQILKEGWVFAGLCAVSPTGIVDEVKRAMTSSGYEPFEGGCYFFERRFNSSMARARHRL